MWLLQRGYLEGWEKLTPFTE